MTKKKLALVIGSSIIGIPVAIVLIAFTAINGLMNIGVVIVHNYEEEPVELNVISINDSNENRIEREELMVIAGYDEIGISYFPMMHILCVEIPDEGSINWSRIEELRESPTTRIETSVQWIRENMDGCKYIDNIGEVWIPEMQVMP